MTAKTPVLNRILHPLGESIDLKFARALVNLRADAESQARIDELADKANEGRLTSRERQEYQSYVTAIDIISILQSKARTLLARSRKR